jgi:hypothetical protein
MGRVAMSAVIVLVSVMVVVVIVVVVRHRRDRPGQGFARASVRGWLTAALADARSAGDVPASISPVTEGHGALDRSAAACVPAPWVGQVDCRAAFSSWVRVTQALAVTATTARATSARVLILGLSGSAAIIAEAPPKPKEAEARSAGRDILPLPPLEHAQHVGH